ncbi:MAG: IS21 family transposase [Chloroflexi bacterium]|nr:IS21 family transposase [Chloroflexota bacterium]
MVRRSFAVRDVTEILIHWQAGRPLRQIARSLGVDRNTVRKYVALASGLGYRPIETHLSSQEWAAILAQHAPQLADPGKRSAVFEQIARYHDAIVAGLQSNAVSTVWQRLRDERGLPASLRSFHRYVEHYLPDQVRGIQPTILRDDPPAGHEAQVDYGYLGLWHDPQLGRQRKLWVFLMVLSHSRHMFIHVVAKMDQQAWLEAHVAAFSFFGGVPLLLVVDNLKAGVLRPDLYDSQINRGYAELAAHYGVIIDPCRVAHPKDKPRVERPIPYIRDSFFAGRSFGSLEDINQAALKWCLSVAGERVHGTTRQRPLDLFQRVEAPALRPLPSQPFEPVTWVQAKVARDCHVQVGRVLYSVPYRYVGKTVAVRLSPRTVEFYLDCTLIKSHVRQPDARRQTDWDDYPTHKARFFQRTPDWCRAQAHAIGPAVAQVVEELLSRHALHYLRQCQGIIGLGDKYGPQRLDAACRVALDFSDPAYRTIRNLLDKGLEGQNALPLAEGSAKTAGAYLHGPAVLFEAAQHSEERKESYA